MKQHSERDTVQSQGLLTAPEGLDLAGGGHVVGLYMYPDEHF